MTDNPERERARKWLLHRMPLTLTAAVFDELSVQLAAEFAEVAKEAVLRDRRERIVNEALPNKPIAFKAGDRIAPGHGRFQVEVLAERNCLRRDGAEHWGVESKSGLHSDGGNVGWWFYPDDRIIEVGAGQSSNRYNNLVEKTPHVGAREDKADLCGAHVCGASWFPCALPKVHLGGHRAGGECFIHGVKYLGKPNSPPQCPQCFPEDKAQQPFGPVPGVNPLTQEHAQALQQHLSQRDKPPWKARQMVVSSVGIIYRLLVKSQKFRATEDDWDFEQWIEGRWIKAWGGNFDRGRGFEPYPRVRDWVRCKEIACFGGKAWQVKKVSERFAYDRIESENGHAIEHLEPASPPVEQPLMQTIDDMRDLPCHPLDTPPMPTLEGPHWDDVVAGTMLTFKGQQLNKCLLGLREAVRDHERRIKDLEGKRDGATINRF